MDLSTLNNIQITTFVLVLAGIVLLISSLQFIRKITKILVVYEYKTSLWFVISVLVVGFIIGYLVHTFDVFNFFKMPINPALMVSLIYFFGAIFVFISLRTTQRLIKTILGDVISEEEAFKVALTRIDIEPTKLKHFQDTFNLQCDYCKRNVSYSLASIVNQHATLPNKGIKIIEIFGVKSIVLSTSHKCEGGRREIEVSHDDTMAFRSINDSKITIGNQI